MNETNVFLWLFCTFFCNERNAKLPKRTMRKYYNYNPVIGGTCIYWYTPTYSMLFTIIIPSHKRTTSLSPPPPNRRSVSQNSKLSPKAMTFIPSPVMNRRGIPSLSPVLTRSRNERSPVNSPILTQRGRPTKRHFPTSRYTLPILVA